ncbi:MAG TPA: transketolase C-terminal domain-containing protein [Anaerovoracaceae bacterium]|nr:transketolase C-terminal domain-containing protein [Anaerovoracaceae bacterium]
MRNTFVDSVCQLAETNKDIFLITGDLGFGVLNKFWDAFPDRFINAGISEQNMTALAAGMALEGKQVYTYSIANFPTLRCLEQIRNDVAYHDANVKIVSIGAGFAYGSAGMSHHATEDLAIMRALPNITVFSPADPLEVAKIVEAANEINGPCYIRLGKGGEPNLHEEIKDFKVGKAINIIDGDNVCIFATGAITGEAKLAAERLNNQGCSTALYSFPTIKPIDKDIIYDCAKKYDVIVTVEEHNVVGGFGSAVSEVLAGIKGNHAYQIKIGINDIYSSIVGNQSYLREYYRIDAKAIEEAIYKAGDII